MRQRRGGIGFVIFSVLVAIMLSMVQMPSWAQGLRPEFLPLVVIFWVVTYPERFGIGFAWTCGLALDIFRDGAIGGQYALTMLLIGFVAIKIHQRFAMYPVWQQALTTFFLMLLFQCILFFIKGMGGTLHEFSWRFWATCFTSTLAWPFVWLFLTGMRNRIRLA